MALIPKWGQGHIYTIGNNTSIYTTGKWIIMASSAKRRDKGKEPAQGSSQDKRLPTG